MVPPSAVFFAQELMGVMIVGVFAIGGIVRLSGGRTGSVMNGLIVLCVATFPSLFFFRPAIYNGVPVFGDVSLGWPMIYAFAQSDVGLASFYRGTFFLDFAVGIVFGIVLCVILLFLRRHCASNNGLFP